MHFLYFTLSLSLPALTLPLNPKVNRLLESKRLIDPAELLARVRVATVEAAALDASVKRLEEAVKGHLEALAKALVAGEAQGGKEEERAFFEAWIRGLYRETRPSGREILSKAQADALVLECVLSK